MGVICLQYFILYPEQKINESPSQFSSFSSLKEQSQAPGFNLPMPMGMFRQLAAQERDLGFDDDEMEPGDEPEADTGVIEENGSAAVSD